MTMNVVVHEEPVWGDRANFVITARINLEETTSQWQWEQLWATQVAENRFVLCCIPFFAYDLALGDEVETGPSEGRYYVVRRVVNPSGHYTFRAWFHDSNARDEVPRELALLGCLMEWRFVSSNLLAIDAASDDQAQAAADLLWRSEQLGHLEYETGRTKAR